jgi:TAG lipase/steryl ester hydrolase/phospholipase A2/LPA acyltransferase
MSSRKLKKLEKQMNNAASYAEWTEAAIGHDELSGARRWREVDQTRQYDYSEIRLRLDRLRSLRVRNDHQGVLFTLNEGIHGNMGGMGRSSLYRRAHFGTKQLIEQYIAEIDDALRFLADNETPDIDAQEKIDFFYRANICFGRSALMLSGGGVLGFYHLGVVKTLLEQDLLPRVISGSSAGSLVAGVVGTHTQKELEKFFDPANVHFEAEREASVFSRMFFGRNPQIDVSDLEKIVARLVPDLTFQEAYEKTGRQISITAAPAEPHQRSRLLNAITSPNVFVRSAVMASCAVPGVFPPVMLMARNVHGESQPYLPTRRWVDGSIADDLPAKRLSRLYSANHYIVSMVNPIATPFLNAGRERSKLSRALGSLGVGMGREMLNFYRGMAQRQGDNWPRFNMLLNGVHALMDQEYSGDINIIPSFRWYNPAKILSHLTEGELMTLMEGGERSTYPTIEAIRTCTRISRTMEEILHRYEYGDLRPADTSVHRPRASRRRPAPTRADREELRAHATRHLTQPGADGGGQKHTASTKGRARSQPKAAAKTAAKSAAKNGTKRRSSGKGRGSKAPGAKAAKGGGSGKAGAAARTAA